MTQKSRHILIGIAVTFLVAALTYGLYQLPTTADQTIGAPIRLKVPVLGVDAPIESVGRTSTGNMESPTSLARIAWFSEGTVPGQLGSAVVAGHLDSSLGRSGVFKNLDALQTGDEVLVETVFREVQRFKVVRIVIYPHDAPPDDLFTRADGTYLNLITCTGTYVPELKTYDERLVVYTELVS